MLLLKGETWFPQKDKRISPRHILLSLSNLVRYEVTPPLFDMDPPTRTCSPAAFRAWIRKWDAKI